MLLVHGARVQKLGAECWTTGDLYQLLVNGVSMIVAPVRWRAGGLENIGAVLVFCAAASVWGYSGALRLLPCDLGCAITKTW